MNNQDEKFLRQAIELSRKGMEAGHGGPFGAVVVKDGEIVGQGFNRVTSTNDPSAHAEIVAIRNACKNLGSFQLHNCTIYSSCEPCPMCLGAVYWARPQRLVYACSQDDAASLGFDDRFIYEEIVLARNERSIRTEQMLAEEAFEVMKSWKEKEGRVDY